MLRDHFHPPLRSERHWEGFHHFWATLIAGDLNRDLPEGYFAEPNIRFGLELDVAAIDEAWQSGTGGVREATIVSEWTLTRPTQSFPIAMLEDHVEVQVFSQSGGRRLVAAIELVSPANKDRPPAREAFVSKCATLVQQAVGLIVVDIVTERTANLHNGLLTRLAPAKWVPMEAALYCCAYRTVERDGEPCLDTWQESLSIGGALPTLPLSLRGGPHVPVALEESYERSCTGLRLPALNAARTT